MTREEAVKILSRIWGGNPQHALASNYTDAFVALGILKLDETKSAETLFAEALREAGFSSFYIDKFCDVLEQSHLKIVEK